jgi:phenolic acid decarboxylase
MDFLDVSIVKVERHIKFKLSLAKECYSMKLELLTNATVVDDAIISPKWINKKKKMYVA